MRYKATEELLRFLIDKRIVIKKVAVVGGSSKDPEVIALSSLNQEIKFSYFGIDNPYGDTDFQHFDLNSKTNLELESFDLVLCSQVLEHVWNLGTVFDNLVLLSGINGYLWINCPASNMAHGSPSYYSAGFSPDFLLENLMSRGHEVYFSKCVGSKRNYFFTHILRHWPSEAELEKPLSAYRPQPGTTMGVVRQYFEILPIRLFTLLFSSATINSIDYATESFSLSKFRA